MSDSAMPAPALADRALCDPLMRGSQLQANLAALSGLGSSEEQAIRAAARGAVEQIEAAIAVTWLPLALDVELTDAVVAVVGHERMRDWAADAIERSTRGPLLRPILTALKALGMTPSRLLGRVPLGWSLIYRHCGALRVSTVDPRTVLIEHVDPPDSLHLPVTYLEGIAGTLEGLMRMSGAEHARAYIETAPQLTFRCVYS